MKKTNLYNGLPDAWRSRFMDSWCAGKEKLLGFDIDDLLDLRQLINALDKTPKELLAELC